MKKYFIIAIFAMFSVNTFAQGPVGEKPKPFFKLFEYTVSIGVGTTASDSPYDNAVVNVNAGVDIKKVFKSFSNDKAKLYGLTGLHFTQHGGKTSNLLDDMMTSGNSFRQIHLNIPIHVGLKYKINDNFQLFADLGPYIGYNGKCSFSEGYGHHDFVMESKAFDFGIGGNIGICFKKFGISIGLDKGFLDIAKFSSEEDNISKNLKSKGVAYIRLQWTFNKQ